VDEDFPRRVASGEKCPQTGHWRCAEDGETLLFHAGQVMPAANLSKPATGLMNWLSGRKEEYSHQGPGHWEWVEARTEDTPNDATSAPEDVPKPEQEG
ncbi:MAG: hypothetical protein LBQ81_05620, partial [Zoogloeaceae bacterium]|jgi:hypothetical protein|nr:hypothetical protein [Zoogloeaceae bacterium]